MTDWLEPGIIVGLFGLLSSSLPADRGP